MNDFRVLLVDDEEELVSALVERLEYRGIAAVYETDSRKALVRLQNTTFDVIVIDLKMPGMSGEEMLGIVKVTYPDLPVLIITGHGFEDGRDTVKLLGAYDFLTKPVDIAELVDKMKEAVKANDSRN